MSARPKPPAPSLSGRLLRTGVGLAVLLALAIYLAVRYGPEGSRAPGRCTVVSGKGDGAVFRFAPEQAADAATIAVVGTSRGMPERAVTIALATAIQESGLRNLDHGDRDSLGLFQQRPSQGWGTAEQIMDPAYAAGRFYEHLAKVPGYSRLPLTVAAQRVQHSAYPQAYAKHEPDATLLAAALTGRAAATLTCEGGSGSGPGDPAKVRKALVHDFGGDVLTSTASEVPVGGSTAPADPAGHEPAAADRAASRGEASRTVTVPVRAAAGSAGPDTEQRGWELAHWAVANSSGLHIERVAYAGHDWSASSGDAWHAAHGEGKDGSRSAGSDRVVIVTAR
ncbi:heavy metal transporter [Streptomyces odontomachi]|uniref:heavy metal transporter n=1 Tax=Streptomyces odontomachi TaxID=2944940 RepID=UPI00210DCBBE|nr:heavy metal transporter [Streptomyces sp. ODS25]